MSVSDGKYTQEHTCEKCGKKRVISQYYYPVNCFYCSKNKHNKSNTKEYDAWRNMKSKCYGLNHPRFLKMATQGITVCDRWLGEDGFLNFLEDMGPKPAANLYFSRKDWEVGYDKENCHWITMSEIRKLQNQYKKEKES